MSKRSSTLLVLAALLIVVGTGTGYAIPSLGGPTGIVSVPNAAIAPMNTLQTALSYQAVQAMGVGMYMYESADDFTVWSLQALTGITEEAELWAAYSSVRDGVDSHIWGIGGKLQLAREPEEAAALAIGASYQQWSNGLIQAMTPTSAVVSDINVLKAYIVATKDFTPLQGEAWEWGPGAGTRMLGSLGLMYIKVDPDNMSSESLARPFVAFEFIGADDTALGLEYRWKDDDIDAKAVFSAVLRHKFSPEFEMEIGTTNANPVGTGMDDQDVFIRLGYNIPMGAVY